MNPRIIKEIRLLFWPWCLVIAAALLPLLSAGIHHFRELSAFLCGVGFFGGIPFLVALSLGGEFQQRTLSILFSQPVERAQIWAEKQMVLLSALLIAVLVFGLSWPERDALNGHTLTFVGAWLIATISSTTFWTLTARSTIGGLVLAQVAQFGVVAVVANLGLRIFGEEPSKVALCLAETIGVALWIGYSGWMLWLSHRKLARFQATGGVAGDDLLMAGPRVLPAAVGDLLRCRATSPTLNLIRKELRLLRPLWLIMLLFMACWICIVITVRLMPQTEEWKTWREALPMIAIAFYAPLAVILAGCLSLGEERSSGTHAWHLTLPVPIRQQWLVKLATALGAGTFSAFMVPFLTISAGQALLGSPFGTEFSWKFGKIDSLQDFVPIAMAGLASFPAFWCASVVNGAVRAALWTVPVVAILCAIGGLANWAANQTIVVAAELLSRIVAHYELNPDYFGGGYYAFQVLMAVLPMLLVIVVALVQSSRLFRTQPGDSAFFVLRRLVPLAVVTFAATWILYTWSAASLQQRSTKLVREVQTAVAAAIKFAPELDTKHPMQLTVEDLAKAGPVSETMRHWLGHARITVRKQALRRGTFTSATILFADGSGFYLNLPVPRE